jgi:dTDP-4-dehydrorhamnose reductase
MATALIDVTIEGLTNEQVDEAEDAVRALLKSKYPDVIVDLNGDTEYDEPEDEEEEKE